MVLLGTLLACVSPGDGVGSGGDSAADTALPDWLPFPPQECEGLRDPVELATAEEVLAANALHSFPYIGMTADLGNVEGADPDCPAVHPILGGLTAEGNCEADGGARYEGGWTALGIQGRQLVLLDGWRAVVDADDPVAGLGYDLEIAGDLTWWAAFDDDHNFEYRVEGSWSSVSSDHHRDVDLEVSLWEVNEEYRGRFQYGPYQPPPAGGRCVDGRWSEAEGRWIVILQGAQVATFHWDYDDRCAYDILVNGIPHGDLCE